MKTITFFSFKGGVGRTALLFNLAAAWAQQGKVVCMMDLDLSAPGLSFLAQRGKWLDNEAEGRGMSDLVQVFEHGLGESRIDMLPPSRLLREVDLPQTPTSRTGQLFLIEAGNADIHSRPDIKGSSIHAIAPSEPGENESPRQQAWRELSKAIREDLGNWRIEEKGSATSGRGIDYLLIDSRTGLTELLDFSLSYLTAGQEDQLVLVAGLNRQNLFGLEYTLKALMEQGRIPIDELANQVSTVFSPVPAAEDEATLESLEQAFKRVAGLLRPMQSGELERPPPRFILHYTPILALREALLTLEWPRSQYVQEVTRIAAHLSGDKVPADDTIDVVARRVDRITRVTAPSETPATTQTVYSEKRPNPFSNLPPWYWPWGLDLDDQTRRQRLDELLPENPAISVDRELFLNRLANSISLKGDEKRAVLDAWPGLKQNQVEELVEIFAEEQAKFAQLHTQFSNDTFDLFNRHFPQWATAVLGDEEAGWRRYTYAPVQGESLFPYAEHWGGYWGGLAGILVDRFNDGETAIGALEKGFQVDEDPARLLVSAIRTATNKQPSQTVVTWDKVLQWYANRQGLSRDAQTSNNLGNELTSRLQRYDEAEQAYRQAIELDKKIAYPWNGLGNLLKNHLRRYDEAEQAYRKAIELDEKSALPWYGLGNLLTNHLQRYDEAEQAYRKAIELDEKYASPWNGLGILLGDLQRYDEAEQAYRKAIELDKKIAYPWYGLGNLLKNHLHRYDEAEQAYRKAIELDEKYDSPWNGLGNLLKNHLHRYDEAEQAYRKAIELDEKSALPWNGLGLLYQTQKDCTKALEAFDHGLVMDEKDPYSRTNRAHLHLGMGDSPTVADELQQAVALFHKSHNTNDKINALQISLELDDNPDEARAACEQVLDKQPDQGEIHAILWLDETVNHIDKPVHRQDQVFDSLASYHEWRYILNQSYLLAGMRPDARDALRKATQALLALPPKILERFEDQPTPEPQLAPYRAFAEGRSDGAGDPRDLPLICNKASDPE